MGLNQRNIQEYLDKFWEGKTTLEEECAIKEFFMYHEMAEEHKEIAAYFQMLSEVELPLSSAFDERIKSQLVPSISPRNRMLRINWRVAAAIIVLLGLSLLFNLNRNEEKVNMASPQLANESPEVREAFEQAKLALFLVSTKLNQGKSHTAKLTAFNDAEEAIKIQKK